MNLNAIQKIFFTILIFLFSSCSNNQKTYYKPIEASIQTLNPKLTRMRIDFMIAKTIFGQLLNYDSFGNIQPGIFKTWHVSDDGKTYQFKINPENTFHDGTPVTIEDVIFTLHFLASPDSLISRYFVNIVGFDDFSKSKKTYISGIKKISNDQLQIDLANRSFVLLSQLADPKVVLLPSNLRGQTEEVFFKHPIGAGAYRLKSMNENKTHLILERFDKYDGSKSNIKFFDIQTYDKKVALDSFKAGKLNDLEAFIFDEVEIEGLKKYGIPYSTSSYSINLLFMNGREKLFQDKSIRDEIAQSLDLAKVLAPCRSQVVATTGLIPMGLRGWSDKKEEINITHKKFSNVKKQKNLKILTYGNRPPKCVLTQIANAINQGTRFNAGYDFETEDEAVKTFINGDYDLFLEDLSVRGPEPLNIFTFFDPNSSHNLTHFNDPLISEKLENIEGMVGGQRANAYSDLSHYIAQEKTYAIPLYTQIRVFIFDKHVASEDIPAILHGNTPFEKVNL